MLVRNSLPTDYQKKPNIFKYQWNDFVMISNDSLCIDSTILYHKEKEEKLRYIIICHDHENLDLNPREICHNIYSCLTTSSTSTKSTSETTSSPTATKTTTPWKKCKTNTTVDWCLVWLEVVFHLTFYLFIQTMLNCNIV